MQVKTITYQRVLNLGNYESKRLELLAEIDGGEDVDEAISALAEQVERKIREDAHSAVEAEILQMSKQLRELKKELRDVEKQISAAKSPEPEDEPDSDNIPFESRDTANQSGIPEGF